MAVVMVTRRSQGISGNPASYKFAKGVIFFNFPSTCQILWTIIKINVNVQLTIITAEEGLTSPIIGCAMKDGNVQRLGMILLILFYKRWPTRVTKERMLDAFDKVLHSSIH